MKTLLPDAVEKAPWKALGLILFVTCGPACNMTFAEWRDAIDTSPTTAFQGELVLDAWVDALRTIGICIYAYLTRSGTKSNP